ncbi:hypothetical protein P5E64_10260 [Clostridium perfringens]|uniref:hypothetical protein n=1 Tax=Clostridium perfringens TaxID=1502 RepID=UPI001896ECB2|nr:hypothetical protein [Clostridium perfringens]EHR1327881.1 hypothetical protein [Clostridium perfringens]EHR1331014.1 hypothetical protein [Clostridium perfringens]EHR1424491.1 hypothetical protein [Clostridium perfringens]EJT6165247.1 hypothetical protein [Clostridium perfringens]EJT6166481.1 hypothetical protein [Clostridium perfringens]
MKKWIKPELMILGVENTENDFYGSGHGNGNDNGRPSNCYCEEFQFGNKLEENLLAGVKGHDHGAWVGRCPCCGLVSQSS